MKNNYSHYKTQLIQELLKTNDPPYYSRISSLVYDGKIEVTDPNNNGLSIIEQIKLCAHIKEKYKPKIIECCKYPLKFLSKNK